MYLYVCALLAKMYWRGNGVPLAIHRGPGRATFGFGLTLISRVSHFAAGPLPSLAAFTMTYFSFFTQHSYDLYLTICSH